MNSNTLEIARQILAQNERLLSLIEGDAPAKVERPKAEPKQTRKAAKPQVKATKAPAKVTCLTRKNRLAFVKAHPWAKGLSTQTIAAMAVEEPGLLKAGWAVGAGYTALVS